MTNKDDSENDIILEMHSGNYEVFGNDNSVQCYNENEDWTNCNTSEEQESDEDDTTKREWVTNQDARKFTAVLLIMQEGNEGSPISPPETCTDVAQL
jgi:hypothetical protein